MARSGLPIFCTVLILVSIFLFPLSRSRRCPTDSEVVPVDLSQLTGEWYMVSGTTVTGQAGTCLHFQVDNESEGKFRMNFSSTSYRNGSRVWWDVDGTQSGNNLSATWQINGSPNKLGPFQHRFLVINYTSHGALIVCANDTRYIRKQFFAIIWSRQRTLAEPTLTNMQTMISTYIAAEDIININNTCTELDTVVEAN